MGAEPYVSVVKGGGAMRSKAMVPRSDSTATDKGIPVPVQMVYFSSCRGFHHTILLLFLLVVLVCISLLLNFGWSRRISKIILE